MTLNVGFCMRCMVRYLSFFWGDQAIIACDETCMAFSWLRIILSFFLGVFISKACRLRYSMISSENTRFVIEEAAGHSLSLLARTAQRERGIKSVKQGSSYLNLNMVSYRMHSECLEK